MSLKDLGDFIAQVGFPVFVACVLLFQVIHMHRENHESIDRLAERVQELLITLRGKPPLTGDRKDG